MKTLRPVINFVHLLVITYDNILFNFLQIQAKNSTKNGFTATQKQMFSWFATLSYHHPLLRVSRRRFVQCCLYLCVVCLCVCVCRFVHCLCTLLLSKIFALPLSIVCRYIVHIKIFHIIVYSIQVEIFSFRVVGTRNYLLLSWHTFLDCGD